MSLGNEVQARAIADQVAVAAVERYAQQHPGRAEIPPPLKWAGAIIGALLTACVVAMCFWVVSTLSSLQQTVTRIDERQQMTASDRSEMRDRLGRIEERLARLEGHQ